MRKWFVTHGQLVFWVILGALILIAVMAPTFRYWKKNSERGLIESKKANQQIIFYRARAETLADSYAELCEEFNRVKKYSEDLEKIIEDVMVLPQGYVECAVHFSAFSGEVVFAIQTVEGEVYEGVTSKYYVKYERFVTTHGVYGQVRVSILKFEGDRVRVRVPDSGIIDVSVGKVRKI